MIGKKIGAETPVAGFNWVISQEDLAEDDRQFHAMSLAEYLAFSRFMGYVDQAALKALGTPRSLQGIALP